MDNRLKACKSVRLFFFKQPQTISKYRRCAHVSNKTIFKQPQTISNNLKHRNNYKRRKPYNPQNIIYEKTFDLGNGTSLG